MLIYFLIFLISSTLLWRATFYKPSKNLIFWIGALIPSIFAALRALSVGTDTMNYYDIYIVLNSYSTFSDVYDYPDSELMFKMLSYFSPGKGGFSFLMFVYQFITVYCLYDIVYKYRKNIPVWMSFWLYFAFFFCLSLNIMRQICAIFYVVDISYLLLRKRTKLFLIMAILSIIIHTSAILACLCIYVLYLIMNRNKMAGKFLFLIYLSGILGLFIIMLKIGPILSALNVGTLNRYQEYIGGGESYLSGMDLVYRAIYLAIILLSLMLGVYEKKYRKVSFAIVFTELVFYSLGLYNKWLARTGYYFLPFVLYGVLYFCSSPRFTRMSRYMLLLGVFILSSFYCMYINGIAGSNETVPYSMSIT